MWTQVFSRFGKMVARGLVRWLELLGQNPPLSRDHGFYAWRYLHETQRQPARPRLQLIVNNHSSSMEKPPQRHQGRHRQRQPPRLPGGVILPYKPLPKIHFPADLL